MFLGGCAFDPDTGELSGADGLEIELRPHTRAVLRILARADGAMVTRDALLDEAWPDTIVSGDSLYQAITEIRRALGDRRRSILQTVPRKGYRLVASAPAAPMPEPGGSGRMRYALVGAAAALCALLAGWVIRPAPATGPPSVAVLPFVGEESGARWDVLAKAMSGEVASTLAGNRWLHVYGPEGVDAARFRLSGRIVPDGAEIRVQAELTEADSGRIVWSRHWGGQASAYFDLQHQVALAVASELGGHWSGAVVRFDVAEARGRPTDSLDAYELFLRGTQAKHRFSPGSLEEARDLLQRAVALDPGFAEAWTTLSVVQSLRSFEARDMAALRRIIDARAEAVRKAAELAPEDPTTLMELGWLHARDRDYEAAGAAIRRAVALAPENPDVLAYAALIGNTKVDLGAEGRDWVAAAYRLNPDPPDWYRFAEGYAAFTDHDWDAAINALRLAPPIPAGLLHLAVALEMRGDPAAAEVAAALRTGHPAFSPARYVIASAMDPAVNGDLLVEVAARLGLPAFEEPVSQ